jgi:hypothetical protein
VHQQGIDFPDAPKTLLLAIAVCSPSGTIVRGNMPGIREAEGQSGNWLSQPSGCAHVKKAGTEDEGPTFVVENRRNDSGSCATRALVARSMTGC